MSNTGKAMRAALALGVVDAALASSAAAPERAELTSGFVRLSKSSEHGKPYRAWQHAKAQARLEIGPAIAALIVRDVCESDRADPDAGATICIATDDLEEIVRRHIATQAAGGPWDSPLSDFREGQWWVLELDRMAAQLPPEEKYFDFKRAVAVVHHLLRVTRPSAPLSEPTEEWVTDASPHGCHWKDCPHGAECVHAALSSPASSAGMDVPTDEEVAKAIDVCISTEHEWPEGDGAIVRAFLKYRTAIAAKEQP